MLDFECGTNRRLLWENLASETYLRNTSTLLPAQLLRLVNEHVRRHSDILSVSATIRKAEDGIAFLEFALATFGQLLDRAGELDTHGSRSLRGEWVVALTLHEIHAVEAESFYFDESLGASDLGPGDVVDEHAFDGAFAIFDICRWKSD